MSENKYKQKQASYRFRNHPFWHADKPYLHGSPISDFRFRILGYMMCFIAGGINAGGFFAIGAYTSHVSGYISRSADDLFVGNWQAGVAALFAVIAFLLGAAHSGWTILWAKRQRFRSCYGLSMWLEAVYLLLFGLAAHSLPRQTLLGDVWFSVPIVLLLSCIMGMHNTVMTSLSGGAIRTTHMTGTVTDLGIELAKVLYYRRSTNPRLPDVRVNRIKMRLFLGLLVSFISGGIVGAWGYARVGYHFTLPMAAMLFLLGFNSIGYDVRIRLKWWLRKKRHAHRSSANRSNTQDKAA